MTRILVIDNYDSFVYTLVGYLNELGAETVVVRNDHFSAAELAAELSSYDGLLLSPGPGNPAQAGVTVPAVRIAVELKKPLLGVCLGHQALAEAFGATVSHATQLMHGKTSEVTHQGDEFFAGIPATFTATRYHSLAVVKETMPAELVETAATGDGVIMALRHRELPLFGVQYHPESVMTEYGYLQLGNWLELVGLKGAADRARKLSPLIHV